MVFSQNYKLDLIKILNCFYYNKDRLLNYGNLNSRIRKLIMHKNIQGNRKENVKVYIYKICCAMFPNLQGLCNYRFDRCFIVIIYSFKKLICEKFLPDAILTFNSYC